MMTCIIFQFSSIRRARN